METPQQTLSFDESVKQVMQTLPPPIRNYLAQGKYTAVAKSLMTKYGLRIDQGGVLEREIMLLLMGIDNPEEFTQALVEEARLDQQVVSGIVQEVNAQIFVPLREEMKRGAGAAPVPTRPSALSATLQAQPMTAPGATEPPSYFHLQNKLPIRPLNAPRSGAAGDRSAPQSGLAAQPTLNTVQQRPSTPVRPVVSISSAVPKAPQQPVLPRPASNIAPLPPKMVLPRSGGLPLRSPTLPRPVDASRLLEDHEEPHIEFPPLSTPTSTAKAPSPVAETPLRQALRTVMPPPNLPGTPPPPILPKAGPQIPQTRPNSAPSIAPPRPYSSDPYREPIE
jgi:hypothetical protein